MKKHSKKSNSRMKRLYQDEALQKRIKDSRDRTRGKRSNIFKPGIEVGMWYPDKGDHIIDIIPYIAGKNDPATEEGNPTYTFEYLVHRLGPNQDEYLCRRMYGKECPACERREKLREDDDENYKKWWPKPRNLYNIVCHDNSKERKKGIQLFDIAQFYFEKHLVTISRVPSRGGEEDKTINFVHPKKGRSISFTVEPKRGKDDFPKFLGHTLQKRNYEIDEDLLEEAKQLDQLVRLHSYEEMKAAMMVKEEDEELDSDFEEQLDELEEITKMKKLVQFCEENDLDVDEDGNFKREKKKVKKQIEEKMSSSENEDEDEDYEGEDDEEEDEDAFDEDEDEDMEDEEDLDLSNMVDEIEDFKEMKAFIKENDLDFKINKSKSIKWNKKKLKEEIDD